MESLVTIYSEMEGKKWNAHIKHIESPIEMRKERN